MPTTLIDLVEATINGKSKSKSLGYKEVVPIKPLSDQKVRNYSKPTRKQTLRKYSAQTRRKNPIVEAMDGPVHQIHGASVFRVPPILPPVYETQLKEINEVLRGIKSYNKMVMNDSSTNKENENKNSEFKLKFNEKVIKERCEWPFGMDILGNEKKKEVVGTKFERHSLKDNELLNFIHKSSWKNEATKKHFLSKFKLEDNCKLITVKEKNFEEIKFHDLENCNLNNERGILSLAAKICSSNKTTDSYLTRNVPYMLEVWQESEKVNLEKLLAENTSHDDEQKKNNKEKIIQAVERLTSATGQKEQEIDNFLKVSKRLRSKSISCSNQHPSPEINLDSSFSSSIKENEEVKDSKISLIPTVKEISNSVIVPTAVNQDSINKKTLSKSTIKLLRKLIKDSINEQGLTLQATPSNIDFLLRTTLTGHSGIGQDATQKLNEVATATRSNETKRQEKRKSLARKSKTGSPSVGKEGEYLNNSINVDLNEETLLEVKDQDFKLILPPPEAEDDGGGDDIELEADDFEIDEDLKNLNKTKKNNLLHNNELNLEESRTKTQDKDKLKKIILNAKLTNDTFKMRQNLSLTQNVENDDFKVNDFIKEEEDTEAFNLNHFVGEVRLLTNSSSHKEKEKSNPNNLTILTLSDFLYSPYKNLNQIPHFNTEAYSTLFHVLSLALRECDHKQLKYEAVKLLLQLKATQSLTRWDALTFRETLRDMLRKGSEDEKLLSALSLIHSKQIDYISIKTVVEYGLGLLQLSKTKQVKEVLLSLDKKYLDCLEMLEKWVRMLAENVEVGTPINFNTINPLYQNPVNMAVQYFLDLMWNDWSSVVRTTATNILAHLGVGKPVFDWIINLLSHVDPNKRIEALSCFGQLKILTNQSMMKFLNTFDDNFTDVRIEACKVACVLATNHRLLINKLIEKCDDIEWKVRAYAIKALGLSGYSGPKLKETLLWLLYHEPHSSVKAEAIRATFTIMRQEDNLELKEGIYNLLNDKSDLVRKEAERVLQQTGFSITPPAQKVISKSNAKKEFEELETDEINSSLEKNSKLLTSEGHKVMTLSENSNAIANTMPLNLNQSSSHNAKQSPRSITRKKKKRSYLITPKNNKIEEAEKQKILSELEAGNSNKGYPHKLLNMYNGHTQEEIEIILRTTLVTEKELEDVIFQVKDMAKMENILTEINSSEKTSEELWKEELTNNKIKKKR
ncbi:HEAT repeat-containing protein 4 [Clydaea vesicula]|uniref:HEAT repeat-containing protein 4 n=1 Tax=Clydaea vesicula TaxID=447962 RepID=A0AAD5U3H1_9FUNG|nr:HEAT repeat-containing protein 4 [Clydaea vesicula]